MKDTAIVVAAIQWDVRRGDVAHNLERATTLVRTAAASGARLAVLPEMWSTSFVASADADLVAQSNAAVEALRMLSVELRMVIVGSALEHTARGVFNSASVFDNGRTVVTYRKVHLFSPTGEDRFFQVGNELGIADTSVGRIGAIVCYDLRFPELTRLHFLREVQILAVPAQWPASRATHWHALIHARAIENQCFVIGANRCGLEKALRGGATLEFPGNSLISNPMGETIGAGDAIEGAACAEMRLSQIKTIHRLLPIRKDRRGDLYGDLWRSEVTPERGS